MGAERIVRYYLHRWPSQRAMKRLRDKVRDRTGRNRVGPGRPRGDRGPESRPARLGQLLPHRQRRRQVPPDRPTTWCGGSVACMVKKRGRNLRAGQVAAVDRGLVQRARPAPTARHHPLPEGCVTMSRRSSVSRMRENRTYGLKGGWGNRAAQRYRAPDYQWADRASMTWRGLPCATCLSGSARMPQPFLCRGRPADIQCDGVRRVCRCRRAPGRIGPCQPAFRPLCQRPARGGESPSESHGEGP